MTFVADQILGIERKLNSILINQKMDSNIINYQFLKNTADVVTKIATEGYLKELTSYTAQKTKTKQKFRHMGLYRKPKVQMIPEVFLTSRVGIEIYVCKQQHF